MRKGGEYVLPTPITPHPAALAGTQLDVFRAQQHHADGHLLLHLAVIGQLHTKSSPVDTATLLGVAKLELAVATAVIAHLAKEGLAFHLWSQS